MTESFIQANQQGDNQVLISPNVAPLSLSSNKNTIPLQLGIMASGSGTNFEAVAKAIASGKLNATIQVVIYNNSQAKVREKAERHNIPTVFIDHRQFSSRENLDQEIVATLKAHNVEWVIMAGWMRIITQVLLDGYPNRVINIHPSLLPSFKGIRAINQALAAQVKITGCTVHLVDLEVDSGEIIMQAAVPIMPDDTLETLHSRIQEQEHQILPQAIAIAAAKSLVKQ